MARTSPAFSKRFSLGSNISVTVKKFSDSPAIDLRRFSKDSSGKTTTTGVMLFSSQYANLVKLGGPLISATMDDPVPESNEADGEGAANLGGSARAYAGGGYLRILFLKRGGVRQKKLFLHFYSIFGSVIWPFLGLLEIA